MKQHGIGVGYKFPHDFEDHDVAQQYLPDKLQEAGRRYYVPTEQGVERQIGERMDARQAARSAGAPKRRKPSGPAVDSMRISSQVTRIREGARKELDETHKKDAAG
jgi:hypothetical protein